MKVASVWEVSDEFDGAVDGNGEGSCVLEFVRSGGLESSKVVCFDEEEGEPAAEEEEEAPSCLVWDIVLCLDGMDDGEGGGGGGRWLVERDAMHAWYLAYNVHISRCFRFVPVTDVYMHRYKRCGTISLLTATMGEEPKGDQAVETNSF